MLTLVAPGNDEPRYITQVYPRVRKRNTVDCGPRKPLGKAGGNLQQLSILAYLFSNKSHPTNPELYIVQFQPHRITIPMTISLPSDGRGFGPTSTVAVVGAGISGVTAAAHLLKLGLSVTVFERSNIAGGVWHFDKRVAKDPSYPSETPSNGDYRLSVPGEHAYHTPPPEASEEHSHSLVKSPSSDDALEVQFSPPGPCYAGLKNNVPTSLMVSALDPWPKGTEEITTQDNLESYIQLLARQHSVNNVTRYNTRVDELRKGDNGTGWVVRTVSLQRVGGTLQQCEKYWDFDLVVVASGHYNLPRIPDTEGLKEWKSVFSDRVIHSKQYRKPQDYAGKNVLVVGAGVSSVDICRELGGVANKLYQSARGGRYDLPPTLLPPNSERVGEVLRYTIHDGRSTEQILSPEMPIPGTVVLKDGQTLIDIHYVIMATGYIISYPFLGNIHSDSTPAAEAGPDLLVTSEGCMTHNLHKDIFYIQDPSLAFVGVPYHIATFSLFDFQSQVVARVFAGQAYLPTREEMRGEYDRRLRNSEIGRGFHSLHEAGREIAYVKDLVDWINRDAIVSGALTMAGHTQDWLKGYWDMKSRLRGILGSGHQFTTP